MKRYAYLSGEHASLPLAELRAILEAEARHYRILAVFDQVVVFEAQLDEPRRVVWRAGMVKEVGRLITVCEASTEGLKRCLDEVSWQSLGDKGFAVRPRYIKGYARQALPPREAVKIIAKQVASSTGLKVNLEHPDSIIRLLVTEGVAIVGVVEATRPRGGMHGRRPRARPFFKPGALSPALSRVFVNLSRLRRRDVFLDPFCGTGGFAIEASLIGAYSVCGDLDRIMAWGSRINLSWMGLEARSDVYLGDACSPPIRFFSIDAVATDPPYGRSTSMRRRTLHRLLEGFLYAAAEMLKRGRYVSFASPLGRGFAVEDVIVEAGLIPVERHYMRVHRSLTRIVAVARRP